MNPIGEQSTNICLRFCMMCLPYFPCMWSKVITFQSRKISNNKIYKQKQSIVASGIQLNNMLLPYKSRHIVKCVFNARITAFNSDEQIRGLGRENIARYQHIPLNTKVCYALFIQSTIGTRV